MGLLVRHGKRQNDAVSQAFRYAARSDAYHARNGESLLKIGVVVV